MILRSIRIKLNGSHIYDTELPMGENSESLWFGYRGFNLGHFLSLRLRNLKFREAEYGQIVITALSGNITDYVGKEGVNVVNNLIIKCSFDKDYYRSLKTVEEYNEYYIKLYKEGIENILTRTDQPVPKQELFQWMEEYRDGDYKNVWEFKKRLFREVGIRAVLDCEMTLEEFNLTLRLYRSTKNKELLFEEVILTTPPDEIYFHHQFKDIRLKGNNIEILTRSSVPENEVFYSLDVSAIKE